MAFNSPSEWTDEYIAYRRVMYYNGLPSRPKLVAAKKFIEWDSVSGLDSGYPSEKTLETIGRHHPLSAIWNSEVAPALLPILRAYDGWNSLDVVAFKTEINTALTEVQNVIWIGVEPETMTPEVGMLLVEACEDVLRQKGITGVDVEIRETSIRFLSSPPKPLSSRLLDGEELNILPKVMPSAMPFSNSLGLPISSIVAPSRQMGTTGLCLVERDHPDRVLLLTAQHVVAPPTAILRPDAPDAPDQSSTPRISLFNDPAYAEHVASMNQEMNFFHDILAQPWRRDGERSPYEFVHQRQIEQLSHLQETIAERWGSAEQRMIGRPYGFPSIASIAEGEYSIKEDWALVDIDKDVIGDPGAHNRLNLRAMEDRGLARRVDLEPPLSELKERMLPICGIADKASLSPGGIAVLKRGSATGLTLGMTSPCRSYLRTEAGGWQVEDLPIIHCTDDRWPYGNGPRAFARDGDSGSVVVSRDGQVCGLLTSGNGSEIWPGNGVDIAYATPMWWVMERIKAFGVDVVLPEVPDTSAEEQQRLQPEDYLPFYRINL